jgi:hypothetical protein
MEFMTVHLIKIYTELSVRTGIHMCKSIYPVFTNPFKQVGLYRALTL